MITTIQRTRLAFALIVAVAGLQGAPSRGGSIPTTGVPVPQLADLDLAMRNYMTLHNLSGGVLAVSKDGCVVYQRGFGWLGESYPLPENTPMRLASVEKPLTAATIRKLAQQGFFSLNGHVFDLGQPGGGLLNIQPWQGLGDARLADITVEHLLLHQGGWDAEFVGFDPQFGAISIAAAMGIASPPGRVNTVRYMLSQPLQFDPGNPPPACDRDEQGDCLREPTPCHCRTYSNFGYMLLGLIVEQFAGPPHVDAVRSLVLSPEMWVPSTELFRGRTFLGDQSPREPRYLCPGCSCLNVFDPGGPHVPCPYGGWDHEAMTGHGNLVASAAPLLIFLDHYAVSGGNIGMPLSNPRGGWHTGALDGTSTIARQRSDGINVVVLFNQRMPGNDPDLAAAMSNTVYALLDAGPVDWPTFCVDGSWVDFNASFSGFGGYDDPFHTMDAALAATAPGVKLHIKPGASNWTGTLGTRMRIDAPFGVATIGQ